MSSQKRIAAFDLDRTLVTGNCSFDFCRFLVSKGVFPRRVLFYALIHYLKTLCFGMSLSYLHRVIFSHLLKGRCLIQLQKDAAAFISNYLRTRINHRVFSELRRAQHLGDYTLILSSSPSFLVKPIAEFFGVDEFRSTEYAADREKKLSHVESVMEGEQKASYLKKVAEKLSIDRAQITVYTDSIFDLLFLSTAGNPIAVSPDRRLKKISLLNRWKIL